MRLKKLKITGVPTLKHGTAIAAKLKARAATVAWKANVVSRHANVAARSGVPGEGAVLVIDPPIFPLPLGNSLLTRNPLASA